MQIEQMSATFGRLNGSQLGLQPGLNVICAPNESGKSTWCRFLQNMLYGVPTKERGLLADKNRYAPWSGSPMQGRLLLRSGDARYTLLRETRRTTAPMGDAHLTYTGTADPVPGIPAAEAVSICWAFHGRCFCAAPSSARMLWQWIRTPSWSAVSPL